MSSECAICSLHQVLPAAFADLHTPWRLSRYLSRPRTDPCTTSRAKTPLPIVITRCQTLAKPRSRSIAHPSVRPATLALKTDPTDFNKVHSYPPRAPTTHPTTARTLFARKITQPRCAIAHNALSPPRAAPPRSDSNFSTSKRRGASSRSFAASQLRRHNYLSRFLPNITPDFCSRPARVVTTQRADESPQDNLSSTILTLGPPIPIFLVHPLPNTPAALNRRADNAAHHVMTSL
ncbi:hypothetical protein B0H13DRAFT_2378563 [Mycena leptocephala]|nr:hypothetical protein B0H13DRAFT_2378563 [Mycena leptocephala]